MDEGKEMYTEKGGRKYVTRAHSSRSQSRLNIIVDDMRGERHRGWKRAA